MKNFYLKSKHATAMYYCNSCMQGSKLFHYPSNNYSFPVFKLNRIFRFQLLKQMGFTVTYSIFIYRIE